MLAFLPGCGDHLTESAAGMTSELWLSLLGVCSSPNPGHICVFSILLQDTWYPGRIGSSRRLLVSCEFLHLRNCPISYQLLCLRLQPLSLLPPPCCFVNVISTLVSFHCRLRQPWHLLQSLGVDLCAKPIIATC